MSALNSFSVARDLHGYLAEMIDVEDSGRVLETKGLFIIPYDITRLVAFVRCEIDVLSADNETRTLWSNPELSFYGYCHIRRYKQSVGNPVQINQRNQVLFQWFPQENLGFVNDSRLLESFLIGLTVPFTQPYKIYLSSPLITDFSFGFQKGGKFGVKVTIGYFKRSVFPDPDVADVLQDVPNPEDVKNTDPGTYKDLANPNAIPSPPYVPETDDYGESLPGTPPTEEIPQSVPFRVRYNASGPGFNIQGAVSFPYEGPTPTGILVQPFEINNSFFFRVITASGTVNVPYGQSFVTQEQEDAFLDTFEFVEYVYQ